ncbi:MAG: hypothetical protein RR877_00745 [Aurantimicrobium sp.]|uniref:DUF7941 domain-family protein n=1 Tax=Aurantimicrobium sp. TaxID=1930784 RepID=UPI002FC76F89
MKQLITMLNSYPGVRVNEYDFVFSKPVFIPHLKMDQVNVKSKAKSNGYIDQNFLYKRYDLTAISAEDVVEVIVKNEKTLHQLLYALNKVCLFPYQEGGPLTVQDKYMPMSVKDVKNFNLPTLTTGQTVTIQIDALPDSYYFRGSLTVKLKKVSYNGRLTKIDFIPNVMRK